MPKFDVNSDLDLLETLKAMKIPFMLVVGDRDMENGTVSVRRRSGEDLGAMSLEDFSTLLGDEVKTMAIK